MATEEEAKKICVGLVKRKILRVAGADERIYDKEGNVIASGLFGLGKGVEFTSQDGRLLEILRLIINMVGPNEVIEDFEGDTATLPYLGQWRSTTLQRGEIFRWSDEDLRSAFYPLLIPLIWGKFMLIDWLLPGAWFGVQEDWVMLCLNVIPMGWKLAVAIAQHVMRNLVKKSGQIPAELELRRDRPPPCQKDFATQKL